MVITGNHRERQLDSMMLIKLLLMNLIIRSISQVPKPSPRGRLPLIRPVPVNHYGNPFVDRYIYPTRRVHDNLQNFNYVQPTVQTKHTSMTPIRRNVYAQNIPSVIYRANEIYNQQLLTNRVDQLENIRGYTWTTWSEWGPCSKQCSSGLMKRTRKCESENGQLPFEENQTTVKCKGNNEDFKECNKKSCMSPKEFSRLKYNERKKQCSSFDKTPYLGNVYKWMPYIRVGLDECRLYCLASGHRMFAPLGNVKDGTICGKTDRKMQCQDGRCVVKGKSIVGVLTTSRPNVHSNSVQGSLQPTSSSKDWVKIRRIFRQANLMKLGYNAGFLIPVGAKNIIIIENTPSRNYLALKFGDKYVLNGNWQIALSRTFRLEDLNVNYTIRERELKPRERLEIDGPLNKNLFVEILYQQDVVDVRFQYLVPRNYSQNQNATPHFSYYPQYKEVRIRPIFEKQIDSLTPLHPSQSPNSVTQRQFSLNQIRRQFNGRQNFYNNHPGSQVNFRYVISNQVLNEGHKLKLSYKWQIGGITKCTRACGAGEQEFTYRCFESVGRSSGKFVEDFKCESVQKPPSRKRVCNASPCPTRWGAGSWSACSKSCGSNSTQFRTVLCKESNKFLNGTEYENEVDESKCGNLIKPELFRRCFVSPCFFKWKTEPWGQCSSSCDSGIQIRNVYCEHSRGNRIPDDYCDLSEKPHDVQSCLEEYCSLMWISSEWSKCSSACGFGEKTRKVICMSQSGVILPSKKCRHISQPATQKSCQGNVCENGFWATTEWSECSSHCGEGFQYRKSFCLLNKNEEIKEVQEDYCKTFLKPTKKKSCNNTGCAPLWYKSEWQECDKTCGDGVQTRKSVCLSVDGQVTSECLYESRPSVTKSCQNNPCSTKHLTVISSAEKRKIDKLNLETNIVKAKPLLSRFAKQRTLMSTTTITSTISSDNNGATTKTSATRKVTPKPPQPITSRTTIISETRSYLTQARIMISPKSTTPTSSSTISPKTKTTKIKASRSTTQTTRARKRERYKATYKKNYKRSKLSHGLLLSHLRPFANRSKTICFDIQSRSYCNVIAVRLNFCHIERFSKLCCRSCQKLNAK